MISEKKKKSGINQYADQIKEESIRKNFPKENKTAVAIKNFIYCDPPEVILQSK